MQLTELLHQPVPVKLNRAERDDPAAFISRVVDGLCKEQGLEVEYLITDGVSSLKVYADLRGKTLTSSMTIGAPEDRKTAKARVNWLLRQLAKARDDGIYLKAAYGRREDLQATLAGVREDPNVLSKDDPKICPRRFEVKLISDLGRRMERPKTIVQALETHVPEFYTQVGQYLRPWVPSAPRVAAQKDKETTQDGESEAAATESGEASTEDSGASGDQSHPDGAGGNTSRRDAPNVGRMGSGDHAD